MLELVLLAVLAIPAILAGAVAHELCHYLLGWLFGGRPFFSQRTFGVPTQVDFESPDAMSDRQTQLMGGIVVVFPVAFAFFLGYMAATNSPKFVLPLFFLAGGGGVSWTDLFALRHPEYWRRFTKGESISRSDFE